MSTPNDRSAGTGDPLDGDPRRRARRVRRRRERDDAGLVAVTREALPRSGRRAAAVRRHRATIIVRVLNYSLSSP